VDRLSADASFVVRLQHHSGSVELIALPWRLVATGRLAHFVASQGSAGPREPHAAGARSCNAGVAARPSATLPSIEAVGEALVAEEGEGKPAVSAALAICDAVESGSDDNAVPASTQSNAALPWTARLMRWIEANDGAATLWLRDYRLEENGIPHLVATLRTAAGEAGMRLDRVVINGRTHWLVHRPSRETVHAG
jgi:hypothetical protein